MSGVPPAFFAGGFLIPGICKPSRYITDILVKKKAESEGGKIDMIKRVSMKMIGVAFVVILIFSMLAVTAMASYPSPRALPSLGGNIRTNMTKIQRSQLGYTGTKKYSISQYGGETVYADYVRKELQKKGRYFPVDTEHILWCSEFATWCAHKAGIYKDYFYPMP